jgi:hypothetical protein
MQHAMKIPKKTNYEPMENWDFVTLYVNYASDVGVVARAQEVLGKVAYNNGYRVVFERL